MNTKEKGNQAESFAVEYLEQNGYKILERNWFNNHHEIDIIASKDNIVAIIEVRSLSSNYFQEPYQSVNKSKQRMLISAANAYIRRFNINDEVRFDIISILQTKSGPQVEHIESAFYPLIR
jgi:putative endonuclease